MLWGWWNTILDPLSLSPSLFLDRKRSGFVLENTDRIAQWNDISGNNNHATAVTGSAARPTLGADGVVFSADNTLSFLAINSPNTVFLVMSNTVFTGNLSMLSAMVHNNGLLYVGSTTRLFVNPVERNFGVFVPVGGSTTQVYSLVNTTTPTNTFYMNGVGSSGTGTYVLPQFNKLGKSTFSNSVPMTVFSLLMFDRALSDAERQQCEQFLANQYGVNP